MKYTSHAIPNPDMESEQRLLLQLAPEMDEVTVRRLVAAFHDLRKGFEEGRLSYPYSLRGLHLPFPMRVTGFSHVDNRAHQPYQAPSSLS
jgi:hypothetical protein